MNQASEISTLDAVNDFEIELLEKNKSGIRFVIFVGDLIEQAIKDSNPAWELGGVLRSGFLTLAHCGGYIPRCEITSLYQNMHGVYAGYVEPHERKHLTRAYYAKENGQKKLIGNDGLLRTPFYPADDVALLAHQTDGVVEVALSSDHEKKLAQEFLFPNWTRIKHGIDEMPETIAQLRAYFVKRLSVAVAPYEKAAAQAAIKSCDNYMTWGNKHISQETAKYNTAKTKGYDWTFGSDAQMLFKQLNVQRPDNLIQEQANQLNTLTDVLAEQAKANLESAKMQQKFMEWQMNQAMQVAPPAAPPEQQSPAPETAKQGEQTAETETGQSAAGTETPANFQVGQIVTVAGRIGKVVKPNHFGKLKVDFDGTEEIVEKADATPVE
jgi:hypothetical protein